MRIRILFLILLSLFFGCTKSNNENPGFNYSSLSGKIAFSRSNGHIIILDGDNKSYKNLTIKDGANIWEASVSFSIDGQYIAYSASTSEGYQIFEMSVNGSNTLKLTSPPSLGVEHYMCPVWSYKGDHIFYVQNSLFLNGPVFSIKPDGTDLKKITDFDVYRRISVSKDESFIVCASVGLQVYYI